METFQQCPICFSPFEDSFDLLPHILNCGHTVCQRCLGYILKNPSCECPMCRTQLTKRQISDYPKNFIAIPNHDPQDKPQLCYEHKKYKDIICLDCKKIMCYKCSFQDQHKKHELKELDDFKKIVKPREQAIKNQKSNSKVSSDLLDNFFQAITESSIKKIQHKYRSIVHILEDFQQEDIMNAKKVIESVKQEFHAPIYSTQNPSEIDTELLIRIHDKSNDEFSKFLENLFDGNKITKIINDNRFQNLYNIFAVVDGYKQQIKELRSQNQAPKPPTKEQIQEWLFENVSTGLQKARQYSEAIEWEKKALDLKKKRLGDKNNSEIALCLYQIGKIIEKSPNFKESDEYYKKSMLAYIDCIDQELSAKLLGICYDLIINKKALEIQNKEDSVLQRVAQMETAGTVTTTGLCVKGIILNRRDQKPEAVAALDKAIKLNPRLAPLFRYKGLVLKSMNRLDEALSLYQQSIQIDQDYVGGWHSMANLLNQKGENAEALKAFNRALEIDPDYTYSQYGKAMVLEDLNRDKEALELYEEINRTDPNYLCSWNNKGILLKKFGNKEMALDSYNKALEIDPSYTLAHYNKGLLLRDWQKIAEARQAFEMVLKINPKHKDAKSQIDKLKASK